MNQKNNIKSNKNGITDSNNNFSNPQNQRERIIAKIMDKYEVSFQEADKILQMIGKKDMNNPNNTHLGKTMQNNFNSDTNLHISKQDLEKNNSNDKPHENSKSNVYHDEINKNKKDENINQNINNQQKEKNIIKQKSISQEEDYSENKSVDLILNKIIPEYNQQISIKLENVDLTFEVQSEKIDTLKEEFIRTLKRDKSKKHKIHVLKDISFQIYQGEKIGIIGYNGAGKSTLLNVITGIYPPDKGIVTTTGKISPLLSLGAGFDQNFSGRNNIILNGAVLGYEKEYLESKIDEIIEFSELGEYIDMPIKNYSSGMLAKLGFSIATAVNPDILIIDEILGVGDVNFQKKSGDKIRSLMDGRTTVLLVSHSIPQIRALCDKAMWIDNGILKSFGEVNKVCDEYLKDAEKASNEQLTNIVLVNE